MSLASRTRETVKKYPCIHETLRVGVINYSAAARYLPVTGETDAIASALRRYGDELSRSSNHPPDISITMHSSFPSQLTELEISKPTTIDTDSITWLCISGDITPSFVGSLLLGCSIHEIPVHASTANDSTAILCVPRTAGAGALQCIEDIAESMAT